MTYPYENLAPEQFQKLCQALLTKEFPGTQCLPVNQKDGGRDAILRDPLIIFQVKFTTAEKTRSFQAIMKAFEDEIPKINELIKRHKIHSYILLTNAHGTAALESGSIDRLQRRMQEV